ncbi:hypothetical protein HYR53_01705 [Candidatus Acetothermia bacterium]|nr:hypothetical protein [Candidatus Acetothermia bacterium]
MNLQLITIGMILLLVGVVFSVSQTSSLNADVASQTMRLEKIEKSLPETIDVTSLKNTIADLQNKIDSLSKTVAGLPQSPQVDLSAIQAQIDVIQSSAQKLEKRVEVIEGKLPPPSMCNPSVTASVDKPQPSPGSTVTVTVQVNDSGKAVEKAHVLTTWHYKTTNPEEKGDTNIRGFVKLSRNIGTDVTSGYEVIIDVSVTYIVGTIGESMKRTRSEDCSAQATTSFTLQ